MKFTSYKFQVLLSAFCFLLSAFCFLQTFSQNNRLTNERGQLLWQYQQSVTVNEENRETLFVTFVFINGLHQTAVSLRQERFYAQIEWLETAGIQAENEERVDFLTANLAPNQSIVWRYAMKTKLIGEELVLEKSAVLIMDEEYEVRKEQIPEQRFKP